MNIIIIGGTDAPGFMIGPNGEIIPIPGWNPEAMLELTHSLNVIREAAFLKTPGLADAAIRSVMGFVQKELSTQIRDGGVLILR